MWWCSIVPTKWTTGMHAASLSSHYIFNFTWVRFANHLFTTNKLHATSFDLFRFNEQTPEPEPLEY